MLNDLNIRIDIKGYGYWVEAVKYVVLNNKVTYFMTKEIYYNIAKTMNTTPERVERALRHAIDGKYEEISEEDKAKIKEELTLLLQQKSQGVIGYVRNIEAVIEAKKNNEKMLAESRKADERRLENYKKYVKECMENNGITKIETGLGNLSIAKSPISIEITNEDEIPAEFKQEIRTMKIDKKAIADNFKSTGELINGVIIHTDNTNLRIK